MTTTHKPDNPAQHATEKNALARRMLRRMDRLNGWLVKLCGLALVAMVASVTLGILVRFVFSHLNIHISASWTEEVSRYLMIWTVFIGSAVACRRGKLIGVEALITFLPAGIGRALKYLSLWLTTAFYGVLCWVGWQWLEFGQSQTSPVLEMPLAFVNASMVVGGALMILNTLALMLETRVNGRDIRNASIDDEIETALAQTDAQPTLGGVKP